jgi:hypothetical protein
MTRLRFALLAVLPLLALTVFGSAASARCRPLVPRPGLMLVAWRMNHGPLFHRPLLPWRR